MKKIASIVLILSLLASCAKDEEKVEPTEIPVLPSAATFSMDFSILQANDGGRLQTIGNWGRSALIVGFWSTAIGLYTVVPVASFQEAFNHEPVFDANILGWVWEYDFPALNTTYHARLEGTISSEGANWKMYISQDGGFQDFLWYSGVSHISGTRGEWLLNADPNDPHQALSIDWNRNADGSTKDITYTNVVPNDDNNGGSIYFEVTDETDYNRHYEIYQADVDNTVTIQWHKENKNGRVKDKAHYQDEEWHCWDESVSDTDC
ncbi:MAG: hypothetical protein JXQ96_02220 [Cyclobacteriaceae bacterium]